MVKKIFWVVVVFLSTAGTVCAEKGELGVSLDVTYVSKWLSKGVEAYGQQGGWFKTLDVDFYGTGFGLKVTHRNAASSGYVDQQRFDYRPYFKGALFDGTKYFTKYDLSVGYESYTGLSPHKANTTYEWIYAFSWPNLMPYGLVPSYIAHYEYPAFSGDSNRRNVGWVHRFLLGYKLSVAELKNPLNLTTEVAYYDGLGNKVHDWGYFTAGISSKFDITENLAFVPGLYHQVTFDDSISGRDDITDCKLSMKYKF